MAIEGALIAGLKLRDLTVSLLALVLTAGALIDAGAFSRHGLSAWAIASSTVLTGGVAWGRRSPVASTLSAATALLVFEFASNAADTWLFDEVAIVWIFYWFGRQAADRHRRLTQVAVFAYWLAASIAIGFGVPETVSGGPLANAVYWLLSGVLPFAIGRTLAARTEMTRELELATTKLRDEQALRSELAAAAERAKMARELHDVVAHCVSVIVVQAAGARRVARSDLAMARDALDVVEGAGREALVELRRMVGVLRRDGGELEGGGSPGLAHLGALLDRARAAGLAVESEIDGDPDLLSPGLDLVVYRVVQEALTNAIKHAGPARAHLRLTLGARELELVVRDTGRGQANGSLGRSGHGLVGMSERIRLYGGELHTGPGPTGGYEVRARIPLLGAGPSPNDVEGPARSARPPAIAQVDRLTWRWLDPLLASVSLIGLELVAVTSDAHGAVRVRDIVVFAGMALAGLWRRERPLWFAIVVVALAFALSGQVAPRASIVTALYVGLVPAYAVAAWEDRRGAGLGLAILAAASALGQIVVHHVGVGNYAGALFMIAVAWTAGRALRARRAASLTLQRETVRLAAEQDDRNELAVAGERSRIARELHAVVAHDVAGMVIQAEAARGQLDRDPSAADSALASIQSTGRRVLDDMRRILGVLRQEHDRNELVPQPGVDQIYGLIQRAREQGREIEFRVDGAPGALPAGVDLGIYRILEEALGSMGRQSTARLGVALHFDEADVELELTAARRDTRAWPTSMMREWVALCGGELSTAPHDEPEAWLLIARMPHDLQGALA